MQRVEKPEVTKVYVEMSMVVVVKLGMCIDRSCLPGKGKSGMVGLDVEDRDDDPLEREEEIGGAEEERGRDWQDVAQQKLGRMCEERGEGEGGGEAVVQKVDARVEHLVEEAVGVVEEDFVCGDADQHAVDATRVGWHFACDADSALPASRREPERARDGRQDDEKDVPGDDRKACVDMQECRPLCRLEFHRARVVEDALAGEQVEREVEGAVDHVDEREGDECGAREREPRARVVGFAVADRVEERGPRLLPRAGEEECKEVRDWRKVPLRAEKEGFETGALEAPP